MKLLHLLMLDVFKESEIIAGEKGLEREVTWVNMMEILDSLEQLQEGELLISTGYGLTEDSPLAMGLISKLNERHLAGIAIQPGYYITQIPQRMIKQANELDFPIIQLQPKITFGKVTRAILDFLTQNTMSKMELPVILPQRASENLRFSMLEEFFDDLLNGNFHSYHEALIRAGSIGLEISSPYKVAVVDAIGRDQGQEKMLKTILNETRELIMSHPLAPKNIHSRIRGNHIILIYMVEENTKRNEQTLFRNIGNTIREESIPEDFYVGIGKETTNWQEFKESYQQAITALEIGKSLFPGARVTNYEDLGLYRLLCQIRNRKTLQDFMEETIHPLAEYDSKHSGELCKTLRYYLEKNNQQETAAALVIHRQTLGYRLRKISDILKRDLNNSKDKFDLYIGLLIMDIIDSEKSTGN